MTVLVVIVTIAVVVVVIVASERRRTRPRRKREGALREVASRLGFTYHQQGDPFQEPFLDRGLQTTVPQFRQAFYGYPHVLAGVSPLGPVRIFDVWHSRAGADHTATKPFKLTVAGFASVGDVRLPKLHIVPEGRSERFSDALFKVVREATGGGWTDLDFATHPVFSERYALRGPEEEPVRALFGPELLGFWESLPEQERWAAATSGASVVVYRSAPWRAGREQEIGPDDVDRFYEGAVRVATAFRDAASAQS